MYSGAETSLNSVKTDGGWLNAQSARHFVETTGSTSMGYSRLTRLLSGRPHTRSIDTSKDLNGDVLVSHDQLMEAWAKFLGTKFASPDADKNRSLECLTAEDDEIGDEELYKCIEALRCSKAPLSWRYIVGRWGRRRNFPHVNVCHRGTATDDYTGGPPT